MKKAIVLIFVILFSALAFAAPVEPMVSESIVIDAPASDVFKYVGNSRNAVEWSVYFDHITPFSGSDGMPGSQRRCFRNKNETGVFWDETIMQVEANKLRVIAVSNLHGFKPRSANSYRFLTKQIYEVLPSGQTLLTLSSQSSDQLNFFEREMVQASMLKTKKVFKENLVNIKAAIEEKANYRRVYQWRPEFPLSNF